MTLPTCDDYDGGPDDVCKHVFFVYRTPRSIWGTDDFGQHFRWVEKTKQCQQCPRKFVSEELQRGLDMGGDIGVVAINPDDPPEWAALFRSEREKAWQRPIFVKT